MGEDAEEYATIWNYTEGKTESGSASTNILISPSKSPTE